MRVRTSSGDSFTREIVEAAPEDAGETLSDGESRVRAGLVSSDLASGDTDEVAKLSPREAGCFPLIPKNLRRIGHVGANSTTYPSRCQDLWVTIRARVRRVPR
jgi:hypothetical protein